MRNATGVIRVDQADLPVDLPHLEDYKPHGRPEPPLAKADDDWLYPVIDGKRYRRETNTMPQWAGPVGITSDISIGKTRMFVD